jgi:DNA repair protein RadC
MHAVCPIPQPQLTLVSPLPPSPASGHRARLRERYAKGGLDALHDYELLEMILSFAIPRRDVKPYAKRLLGAFGGVRKAVEADLRDLEERGGLPRQAALLLKGMGDLWRLARKEEVSRGRLLSSPSDVALYVREELGDRPREVFMVMYLDHRNHVLDCREVQEGTVDHAAVYPREILKRALHLNATGMILAHNHPAGSLSPSEADRSLTRQIQEAARAMGVTVHDHLIVASEGSFSFRQAGIL